MKIEKQGAGSWNQM